MLAISFNMWNQRKLQLSLVNFEDVVVQRASVPFWYRAQNSAKHHNTTKSNAKFGPIVSSEYFCWMWCNIPLSCQWKIQEKRIYNHPLAANCSCQVSRVFQNVFPASRLQHDTHPGRVLSGSVWFINEGIFVNTPLCVCGAALLKRTQQSCQNQIKSAAMKRFLVDHYGQGSACTQLQNWEKTSSHWCLSLSPHVRPPPPSLRLRNVIRCPW